MIRLGYGYEFAGCILKKMTPPVLKATSIGLNHCYHLRLKIKNCTSSSAYHKLGFLILSGNSLKQVKHITLLACLSLWPRRKEIRFFPRQLLVPSWLQLVHNDLGCWESFSKMKELHVSKSS